MFKDDRLEIVVNKVVLTEKIAKLKKLAEGTGNTRATNEKYMWRGYGLTHDAIKRAINELSCLEDELVGLINRTILALETGGVEFTRAEGIASKIINSIDVELNHTGDSGATSR